MSKIWIVVADSVYARFFAADSRIGPITEFKDLVHPEARLKNGELRSDAGGRTFDSAGQGRHAKSQRVEPREEEAQRFAREVGRALETAAQAGEYERLVLVAPPKFLGLLRTCIGSRVQGVVTTELGKDLVHHTPEQIRSALPERL